MGGHKICFRLGTYNVTSGSSASLKMEAEGRPSAKREFDGMGRVGRSSKVSFKILHILWVFRLSIYLLIHEIKIVTDILMGFKM